MIRVTLASNAIHLEAARRLLELQPPGRCGLEILLWEPARFRLTRADARRWRWRLPVRPASFLLLGPLALLGLISELRLAHRRGAGLGLRWLIARARRLSLLDDGLDQYRAQPRAVDPGAFPAGITCWLFSDAPAFRAAWCRRFDCRELGPLYSPSAVPSGEPAVASRPEALAAAAVLLIDAPGLERLADCQHQLPSPRLLVAHPVVAKRRWTIAAGATDRLCSGPPEPLIASFPGLVVVGESMTLLAALGLRPPGSPLLIALPEQVDGNLASLARSLSARDAAIRVL